MTCTPEQFARFRVAFGLYLSMHLLQLVPYASEIYGVDSLFSAVGRGGFEFRSLFPNLLDIPLVTANSVIFVAVLVVLGMCLATGFARRLAAVLLWYGLTCLVNRNPGTVNPSQAFVGWLCLALALVPTGEPWSRAPRRDDWQMPAALYWGAWWVIAVGYGVSGWAKLQSPGWVDGRAMSLALDMPYARPGWVRDGLFWLPGIAQRFLTWGVLSTELLFAPLALFALGRRIAWGAAVAMHFGLLLSFRFWELSAGMLMFHYFIFDARWLRTIHPSGRTAERASIDVSSST